MHYKVCSVNIGTLAGCFQIQQVQIKATTHTDYGSAQSAMKAVFEECGIKKMSIHSLRDSYATHLLEQGLILGNKRVRVD